jgi:hypothetical protein
MCKETMRKEEQERAFGRNINAMSGSSLFTQKNQALLSRFFTEVTADFFLLLYFKSNLVDRLHYLKRDPFSLL